MSEMIDIKDLSVRYKTIIGHADALKNVSFTIKKGSFTGLVGESGSGKSTLIMTLLGLLPPSTEISGVLLYEGKNVLDMSEKEKRYLRRNEISLVPQGAQNSFTPVLKIGRHIGEVLDMHERKDPEERERETERLLREVGLDPSVKERYPHELSGGQKQRAAIALALAPSPVLLLADEPTTALDVIIQSEILSLLTGLKIKKDLSVLLVTHDLPMAASVCDRLIVMKDGRVAEIGTPQEIIEHPRHDHTKALVGEMFRDKRPEHGE